MAKYSWAQLDDWTRKVERRADVVVKQSVNDVIVMASRTAPGKNRGGSVKVGFVPRDLGFLASSLVSQLNGSTMLSGENSYQMIVAGMEGGDTVFFGWTAKYARAQHYKGWLWVDNAAQQWQRIVKLNIAKAKLRSV